MKLCSSDNHYTAAPHGAIFLRLEHPNIKNNALSIYYFFDWYHQKIWIDIFVVKWNRCNFKSVFFFFFFLFGVSFATTGDLPDIRGREGTNFIPLINLNTVYLLFLRAALVITTLSVDDIYLPLGISNWLKVNYILHADAIIGVINAFVNCKFKLASTTTLVLQTHRLMKWANTQSYVVFSFEILSKVPRGEKLLLWSSLVLMISTCLM